MTIATSVQASNPPTIESRDPISGDVWRSFKSADASAIDAIVAEARAAQPAWAALGLGARVRVMERFHRLLFESRREIALLIERETGKPAVEAMAAEVLVTLDFARHFARRAPRVLRPTRHRASGLALWRKRVRLEHEPHGVVGVISPWNYPLMLPAGVLLPALIAGNAVVLKPSELTPAVGDRLVELLREAGVPHAICEIAHGAGATGAALAAAAVDKLFFTGSVETGRRVAMACATRLVPCVLELGGSDPAIVLDDAPVEHAARGIAWGRFANAGQTCVAPKRVFVVDAVHDRFVEAIAGIVAALRTGSAESRDLGPLIDARQRVTLDRQLADAVARGATIRARGATTADGAAFFPPTLLTDVSPDAAVLNEETFGPLLPVVRVRDDAEAIARANASGYGLSASVWSGSPARARRVASALEAGSVVVNDSAVAAGMADVPHGGVKASGIGRSHGDEGMLECVRTKVIVEDRFTSWRQPWWFGDLAARAPRLDAFARLAHGSGLVERASGVVGTLRMLFHRE